MAIRNRVLSRILFFVGALLLAEGSFSVFPFLFPAASEVEIDAAPSAVSSVNVSPGAYLFRLSFPRQKAAFDVVEGTTSKALRKGPGHFAGSAMPGRSGGNVVIAGHRDTHFRMLKDVEIGDEIRIGTTSGDYRYRILETRIVSPKDISSLRPEEDSVVTLITCYPFYFVGPAPKRFVVRAAAIAP
jgi:LPXTG-site transpeptidase (sortase) family protein